MPRGFGLACFLSSLNLVLGQPYVISTIAGGAPPFTPTTAVSASLALPSGVAADASGNVYFTSDNAVFKVDTSGNLTRVAGNSRAGYSGDSGPATSAQLSGPYGVAVDAAGNLYIADGGNNRVRKVTSSGVISTLAGNGTAGFSLDNVPAVNAELNNPLGVAVDSSGNVYIADSFNQRIRKVTPDGNITTVAGNGTCCFSGNNVPAIQAQLHQPESIAVDGAGNLYIADLGNNIIRKVTPAGIIVTVAGTGSNGYGGDNGPATSAQLQIAWAVAADAAGNFYLSDGNRIRKVSGGTITTVAGSQTAGFSGDGGAGSKAQFDGPFGVAVDGAGNLYVADTGNNRVRKVASSNGNITTIAGNGSRNFGGDNGPAINAQMYNPQGVALDSSGNIYLSDFARIRMISSNGVISTVAGNGVIGSVGDNGPANSAQLNQPIGIAVDNSSGAAAGSLYIADSGNNRIRKVSSNGTISTVAGGGTQGCASASGPGTSAQLNDPEDVAVDSAGNLYIADSGNGCVRKLSSNGTITTVAGNGTQGYSGDGGSATAAQLNYPRGVAVDASGNVYIADFGNSRIRKVAANGTITTFAGNGVDDSSGDGGPALNAGISPQDVAVDASGNVLIADFNNLVWKVGPSGSISRIAGNGTSGYSGDGGSAVKAQLTDVRSATSDSAGNIYVADSSNNAIRELRPVASLLSISTPSPLPAGSVNAAYSQTLTAAGGTGPYTWSVVSGKLPAGMSLSAGGVISGTATAAGTATFTVQVADSIQSLAMQVFTLSILAPSITSISNLLQGAVGLSYSQTLSASGGAPPYTWMLSSGSLPAGLTLSPGGLISGTPTTTGTSNFTVTLTDSASNSATQSFTIVVVTAPPLARTGVLAHIAAGGGWSTSIYLANTSSNTVGVQLALHADDGSPLSLGMAITQQGQTQNATGASLTTAIAPNATLVITSGDPTAPLSTGWVDVLTSGPINGFAVFSTTENGTASSGTSPLQTSFESRADVPYDNRSGFVTAAALANLANTPATVTATIWDPTGVLLGTQTVQLPANGHTSFLLPTQFPVSGGVQGIVQFQSSAGNLAGVGLQVSPQGTFTSVPVIEP
ncbi:MAG TPA: putative Ig domain-containing protein [Bryobacteraceae bacterium]|jgi:sugar lactone lactonase YvrE